MMGLGLGIGSVATGMTRRFDPAQLFASGANGAWYDPSDLSSLWQDAAGTVPGAVDQPVGRIADRSGNGRHAMQASAALRPMLRVDGGGRHFLELDGVDDCLATGVWSAALEQPFAFAAGLRATVQSGGDRNLFRGSGGLAVAYTREGFGHRWHLFAGQVLGSAATPSITANFVGSGLLNGASSAVGHDAAEVTGNAGTQGLLTAGQTLTIGGATAGARWPGRIYGLLIVGAALAGGEREKLRAHMAAKAGVAL